MGFVLLLTSCMMCTNYGRLITIAALAFSAPVVILSLVLPDKKLGYVHPLRSVIAANVVLGTDTI